MVGRLELQDVFKEQAEWRREKAKQHPADKRYPEAAAVFDQLAATVDAIPEDVFVVLYEGADVADGLLTQMTDDVERAPEQAQVKHPNDLNSTALACINAPPYRPWTWLEKSILTHRYVSLSIPALSRISSIGYK
jgi:hypothetical protein